MEDTLAYWLKSLGEHVHTSHMPLPFQNLSPLPHLPHLRPAGQRQNVLPMDCERCIELNARILAKMNYGNDKIPRQHKEEGKN
jgi:hypothetical protein